MDKFSDIISQIVAGIFSIVTIVVTYSCNKKMKSIVDQKKENENYPPLTTHPIHINIDEHLRNARQINMDNVSDGRVKLASDFLQYTIGCWKEPSKKFSEDIQQCIENCSTNCNECNKIYTLAMKMFCEGRVTSEQLTNWNVDSDDYEAVIIFRDKFIAWNTNRLERLARKISDIAQINDTYKNCSLKGARILECIDDYLYDMRIDGLHTLSKLNGELDGKTYKCRVL